MERLSIDEIIAHCERNVQENEKHLGREYYETEDMDSWHMKEYWEHRQVAEYLKELKAYRDAEEQGLLLRLPCKVGTKVYVLDSECEGDPYDCHHGCDHCACNVVDVYTYTFDVCMCDDFGKSVFLTKEEADQKLAELKEGAV